MMEPLRNGLMRPFTRLDIEVQPVGQPTFVGTLKAATYRAGTVHHFRVADAQVVTWLVPPAWLSADTARVAEMALDWLDALFLDITAPCRMTSFGKPWPW